ncbi:MAG: biotin--[acetyl-CoA-carboxylase] ligase [Gammaproteobacteria bacterium]|nr:biotin--[acetyl-CoA-carboxylase] ligase [Gammaproteobacteria bacterium]MYC53535.1 biotin--[acetyl-CoA-carboxylase] ligase [Gammaproteobacteria bacterium]
MRGGRPVRHTGDRGSRIWQGEPVAHWAERWGVPLLEVHRRLGSTNDRARSIARAGAPSFSVIIADEQTLGRGREGRRWLSPPGSGLWMTVVLAGRPSAHSIVPLLVGIAAARAIEEVCPDLRAEIEWPNDLVVAGRKVGGILCESWDDGAGGRGMAIGAGINISQRAADFPPELRGRAGSLRAMGAMSVSAPALAGALLARLREVLIPEAPRLKGALHRELTRRDALSGRRVVLRSGEMGTARGITSAGALLFEESGGARREIRSGGVRLLPDP